MLPRISEKCNYLLYLDTGKLSLKVHRWNWHFALLVHFSFIPKSIVIFYRVLRIRMTANKHIYDDILAR